MILDLTATPWLSARHLYERRLGLRQGGRLIEGFADEEPDPHLPQHERQDGKERNNSKILPKCGGMIPPLCLAPNLEGATWISIGTNCKAGRKAIGKVRLTTPALEAHRCRDIAEQRPRAGADPLGRCGAPRDVLVVCSTFRDHRELHRLARPGFPLSVP